MANAVERELGVVVQQMARTMALCERAAHEARAGDIRATANTVAQAMARSSLQRARLLSLYASLTQEEPPRGQARRRSD